MPCLKGRIVACPLPSRSRDDLRVLPCKAPRLFAAKPFWGCQRSSCVRAEGTEATDVAVPLSPPTVSTVPRSLEWELDFSSRPLLDERKKKVWELLVCDPERSFEYAQYFPNNKVNSAELKSAIQQLLSQEGAQLPRRVKFFRAQMKTIINRGLEDLDIPVIPSRRCFALTGWLKERLEDVYPKDPRYAADLKPLFTLDVGPPESLPDNLRGEAWDFVQLPLRTLMNETKDIEKGEIFGASIDLKCLGLEDLPMDTLIPGASSHEAPLEFVWRDLGVSVYSRRAEPLAAWMSGLELSRLTADTDRSCLILDTGVSQRWRYGGYQPSKAATEQAMTWERAKQRSRGLHFLTIQDDPEAEYCYGLWLMVEQDPVE